MMWRSSSYMQSCKKCARCLGTFVFGWWTRWHGENTRVSAREVLERMRWRDLYDGMRRPARGHESPFWRGPVRGDALEWAFWLDMANGETMDRKVLGSIGCFALVNRLWVKFNGTTTAKITMTMTDDGRWYTFVIYLAHTFMLAWSYERSSLYERVRWHDSLDRFFFCQRWPP